MSGPVGSADRPEATAAGVIDPGRFGLVDGALIDP
jgi:hypothetical protein